ncbi:Detected protein of unknown function [Hibiscus syriacus]|uniref:Uncharacterized protein n=1 Tax=Hibiscus syriacus TaxID=106335 RepID=A0A6A2Y2P3_HIBSY|nr:Detected protein of unknown function [Hibiscus syriacus]
MAAPTTYSSQPLYSDDHFIVDDLLDFRHEDGLVTESSTFNSFMAGHSTESSSVAAVDSCNSSLFSGTEPNLAGDFGCRTFTDGQFAGDLCVPVIN